MEDLTSNTEVCEITIEISVQFLLLSIYWIFNECNILSYINVTYLYQ